MDGLTSHLASDDGGAMMAVGSEQVPGGNDLLILYGAPLLQWHAFVSIAVMLITMAICAFIQSSIGSQHSRA